MKKDKSNKKKTTSKILKSQFVTAIQSEDGAIKLLRSQFATTRNRHTIVINLITKM